MDLRCFRKKLQQVLELLQLPEGAAILEPSDVVTSNVAHLASALNIPGTRLDLKQYLDLLNALCKC